MKNDKKAKADMAKEIIEGVIERGESPTPKKEEKKHFQVDFYEALKMVASGKHMTREEWKEDAGNAYLLIHDGQLCIHTVENKICQLIVGVGDMEAKDWVIWKEKSKN